MHISRSFFLAAVLIVFSFSSAYTQNNFWKSKVDSDLLLDLESGENFEFIIKIKGTVEFSALDSSLPKDIKANHVHLALSQKAKESQSEVLEILSSNGAPAHSLFIVNVIKSTGDLGLVKILASRNDVHNIQRNPSIPYQRTVQVPDVSRVTEWGIEMIQADSVWALGYSGQDVTVGGQDTGYEWEHPALKNKYRGFDLETGDIDHNYNWHDAIHEISPLHNDSIVDPTNNPCGLDSTFPCDDNNHGTHTMGTMVGSEGENEIGVAPDAEWCACRNMERGWGTPFTYLECFEWFLAPTDLNNENPDPSKAPHVIANSWGCPEVEGCNPMNFQLLNQAVENLVAAGTVVVVSAGNSGSSCSSVNTPAAIFEASFSVGATNINDTIANFSSRGPVLVDQSGRLKPNVVAPGVNVKSSIRNGQYANFSGTSMAGPHAAGVVALMISARPELAGRVELIEDILELTAIPLITEQICDGISGETIPNHTYGFGRIDALAAVEMALDVDIVSTIHPDDSILAKIYPNPVKNQFTLETRGIKSAFSFTIYAMDGTISYHQTFSAFGGSQLIDISTLVPGIYVGKIESKQGNKTLKIVRQ